MAAAVGADYEGLRSASRQGWPEVGEPIDLGPNGPLGELWPDGAPDGWHAAIQGVAHEIATSPHEPDLPDRTEDPDDPVTKLYHRLKQVLEESLSRRGYELDEDEYSGKCFGSRSICYMGPKKMILLSWDGKERWFTLQRCGVIHGRPDQKWRELKWARFSREASSEDQQRIIDSFSRSIRAFARARGRSGKKDSR